MTLLSTKKFESIAPRKEIDGEKSYL